MKINKKTLTLFSFLSLLAYTGCEDSDDDNVVTEIDVLLHSLSKVDLTI